MRCLFGMRSSSARRAAGLALIVTACGASNLPGTPAPSARLFVGAESFSDDGPFRVVFAGPKGESGQTSDVTIAFSRPLRAPGVLDQGVAAATIRRIDDGARVDGTWHWFGPRTAIFWPSRGFANATEYEVTVDPSLHASDGSQLNAHSPFRFVSQRPGLVSAHYEFNRETDQHTITVDLNQSTLPEVMRSAIRIEGKGSKGVVTVPFTLNELEAQTRFELTVERSIVSLEGVAVIAAASFTSEEGPLSSAREERVEIPEVGPQKVELYCTEPDGSQEKPGAKRCSLERGNVSLQFSKQVLEKDLARHLFVSNARWNSELLTDNLTSYVDLDRVAQLLPGKKYKVVVKAGLTAEDKERLPNDLRFEFETVDYARLLTFRDFDGDAVVEAARPDVTLHLEAMNVASFEAVSAPLSEAQLFELLAAEPRSSAAVRALPHAISSTILTGGKKNQDTHASFALPTSLRGKGGKGLFAVATSAAGLPDDVRFLSVTDLGISTKWSPHGGLVWVTLLSTGAPVANANVSLSRRGKEVYRATTSDDGTATIPEQVAATFVGESSEPTVLVQSAGDLSLSRLPKLSAALGEPVAVIFSERRLYRPGETAYIKGYFRTPSAQGLATPHGRKVRVEAMDGVGRTLFATTAPLDTFGAFSCEMPIPSNARLGFASVVARLEGGPEPAARLERGRYVEPAWPARARFTIDEFRSVEIKLEASAEQEEYLAGESAALTLHGKYLFDAPMHDVAVHLQATRSTTSFFPPALVHFSSQGSGFWPDATGTAYEGNVPLDKAGTAKPAIPLALPNQTGPELVRVNASLVDVSNAFEVNDETSFVVHPSELYLGVRLDPQRPRPWLGKPARVQVAASGWSGPLRPGVPVHVELHYRKNSGESAISTGRSCDLTTTTAEEGVGCELSVIDPGNYWIIATAPDRQGRLARAATSFDVTKDAPAPSPWSRPKPAKPRAAQASPPTFDAACRMAKPLASEYSSLWIQAYKEYDHEQQLKAGALLHTCFRGQGLALFSEEREGVLAFETVHLDGPGTLRDVPVVARYHPNVTLALHTVSGRTRPFVTGERASDRGHPQFEHGSRDIRVARPPEKALKVTIETGTRHRAGDAFDAQVRVTDGNGRPAVAQVTLWAVDEGVLELEPFHVPPLSAYFDDERESQVTTSDTREHLLWERGAGSHRVRSGLMRSGATTAGPSAHIGRRVFRPTAWFLPSLITGPDGTAKAHVKLPDTLTTWRVFAVAANALDSFGEAESAFVTQQPLIARPALPRFLRQGDRFDATVVIDSMLPQPLAVKVQMRASGALAGSGLTALTIPAQGHVPLRFSVTAPGSGKAQVLFRVDAAGGLSDQVTIEEDVSIPTTLETVVLSGETRGHLTEPLGDLQRARADVGGLDFRIASTPLVGLAESLEGLIDYPYGCTEQLSSRLVPLVRLRKMAAELGVALPKDVDGAVRSAIASLLSHQGAGGGFGFWQESDKAEPWLTIQVLSALHASQQAGFLVPQAPVDRALQWLEQVEGLDAASRAMLEALFVELGRPREQALRALAAETRLPIFARALLAQSLAKIDPTLAKQVLNDVATHAQLTGATATIADEPDLSIRAYLSSDARTTALALRAFVAVDPQNPLLARLARGLLSLRRAGRWSTTQESAWALLALDEAHALYARPPKHAALRLSFDGTELAGVNATQVAAGTIPMSKLQRVPGGALSFSAQGAPLFYEASLRYARKEPPQSALEQGIHLTRSLRVIRQGASLPLSDLRVGDQVEVELALASAVPRELVVLDDPVPAGFEAVNQNFANADHSDVRSVSQTVTHRELHDDRVLSFIDRLPAGVTHTSYRLRVIASGRFTHPPAKAECMYAPEVFGRTAAAIIEAH